MVKENADYNYDVNNERTTITNISVIDEKLYILTKTYVNAGSSTLYGLDIINLAKVRIKESDNPNFPGKVIYADQKEDIAHYAMLNEKFKKLLKFKTALEQYNFFVKESLTQESTGVVYIFSFFLPINTATGRYLVEDNPARISKAFDFIIKYYGGGKVVSNPDQKF